MLSTANGQHLRAIPVAKLLAILNDPDNLICGEDMLMVSGVGNLAVVDKNFMSTQMYIDLVDEEIRWPGQIAEDDA